ncbi:hypothetical protein [Paenarthrobacter ureafaciens]|uniref:hypothetical protein n=1 Tax=Paenarthrobacter ureafaciens TaxID=37931 RepID=UPI0009AE4D98|nr:hypothetical protein [Paenarthrobacter ureafaciens]GLU58598.1 hypothetical protein Pure01_11110 [Paenarthrobacter ureafaciens]GLU61843.1 hypothetical protein Pure02_00930 [Paenarthrobacter ureafaciens]GLU66117.1 hypothetical protein Pure03_00930 [Paenarthrobacter ureafaciens]GLU71559.1 hypothetical protein Pure04_12740 [Paenarthrobacter ureafaciens]GLU74654.1 hypothetical protein Pure05_00940 [Paenarthrobacter ureafaciens]
MTEQNTAATQNEELSFDVDITATNGVKIPLTIKVTYPEGYGFYAAKALEAMPNNMDGVYNELIHRQDASVLRVMLESGHAVEDED